MRSSKPSQQIMAFLRQAMSPAVQKKYIENVTRHEKLIHAFDTSTAHYEIVDMVYSGRPARVLFSGRRQAAQSGVALDNNDELLFDYNQRFMEIAASVLPKSVLLIGGGVYTLPKALLAQYPKLTLTIVEPEAAFDEIAQTFFGWQPSKQTTVIHGGGLEFLTKAKSQYDLIAIDAFSHTTIPHDFLSQSAITHIKKRLRPNGVVAMNIISPYYGRGAKLIREQYDRYNSIFELVRIFPAGRPLLSPWISQNYVLTAQNASTLELQLRYAAMPPPSSRV